MSKGIFKGLQGNSYAKSKDARGKIFMPLLLEFCVAPSPIRVYILLQNFIEYVLLILKDRKLSQFKLFDGGRDVIDDFNPRTIVLFKILNAKGESI
tara:strand:+ start:2071 stop:2358 length:288 start_codon:yes stop_codon:yes gene_type:complete